MDQPLEKVKRQYPSVAQKLRLSQLLEADEELRNGKFTATFSKKTASERWEKIALELNSFTGAKKSGKEWRTVSTTELSLPDFIFMCRFIFLHNVSLHYPVLFETIAFCFFRLGEI
ncbi:hypothetical protein JYU34_022552 [Plutella xylostella]|uniref:Regulatory protein zeste n=1 Tax=Plutella xylostella TaxID=51655 RepID=A0ABQ7PQL6_PLUXY|nr:hypothetical protein JYU34_022552 [Plutella xylostella]